MNYKNIFCVCFQSLDDCRVETKLSSKSNCAESTKALNIVPVSYLGQGTETNALPEDPALEASRKLQDLVKSFKSSSAQEDFVHNLRQGAFTNDVRIQPFSNRRGLIFFLHFCDQNLQKLWAFKK